jgi:signal peptide peptidase SppA
MEGAHAPGAGADAPIPSLSFDARRQDAVARAGSGNIAVIPVAGTIVQRPGMVTDWCGGTSTQQISAALSAAIRDETIGQILLEFDSPGGSVYGVAELAAEILAARTVKPVVGIANSLAASAGYWLLSQCTEAYVTPGGEVGSIGVWMAHEDLSKAMEAAGVQTTMISAGKYKTEGNPFQPLDADAKAFLQSRVDEYYQAFTSGVARGRGRPVGAVRSGMGQGRVIGADAAMAEGMVDGVMTFQDVVRKMARSRGTATRSGRNALAAARNQIAMLN